MNIEEYGFLESERRFLERQLESLSPSATLTRLSLQARLKYVTGELAETGKLARRARAVLTFRGRPVVGSRGVFAEFGTGAVNSFVDAVAAVGAASDGPLSKGGKLPNREQHQLLITSTVVGSFGFSLEEHRENDLDLGLESKTEAALRLTQTILESSAHGSDDELAESISESDPRAIAKVGEFVTLLNKHDATCALSVGQRSFRFQDFAEVRRSAERLSLDQRQVVSRKIVGQLIGVLPRSRTFELALESGEIINGKIGQSVSDPSSLNNLLQSPQSFEVQETRIGNGKPKYVLLSPPGICAESAMTIETGTNADG